MRVVGGRVVVRREVFILSGRAARAHEVPYLGGQSFEVRVTGTIFSYLQGTLTGIRYAPAGHIPCHGVP
jgi:hypothetical protein